MLSLVESFYRRIARMLVLSALAALLYGGFEVYDAAARLFTDVAAEARVETIAQRCIATVSVMGAGAEKIGTCAELAGLRNGFVEVSEPAPVTIAHAVLTVAGKRYAKDFRLDPDEVEAVTRSRRIAVAYDPADPAAFREPLGLAGLAGDGKGLGSGARRPRPSPVAPARRGGGGDAGRALGRGGRAVE